MSELEVKKRKLKNILLERNINQTLKSSIKDGIFSSTMVGFGESFFSAFAVFLKANNIQLGLLGSLPQTLGSLSQLLSNKIIDYFKSRKKVVCIGAFLQALMYIPIAFLFLFEKFNIYYLLLFVSLYWIFGTIISPAWNSWIGELVPSEKRGVYFGKRNKLAGFSSFISFLMGGYILQILSSGKTQYIGFTIIFLIAFASRIISFYYLTKGYEHKYVTVNEAKFTFIEFLKKAKFRNYGLFVIYLCTMNFSIYIAAPFFAPYMLNNLNFDYKTFTIVSAAALITKFIMMPMWGKLTDKYGSKKVLTVSGFLMPILPLLWTLSTDLFYLILIQIYSGFVWAGFEMASFNFIFDSTSQEKRATCVAYFNVLNGFFILIGAILGGLIVRYNHMFWSKYYLVFIVSFVLRYLSSLIFLPRLKEVRDVERIPYNRLLFKAFTSMPTTGMIHHLITLTKRDRKY